MEDDLPPHFIEEAAAIRAQRTARGLSPKHGFKFALLGQTDSGSIGFVPLRAMGHRYGASSDAMCLFSEVFDGEVSPVEPGHAVPHPNCECGFYALQARGHLGTTATRSWLDSNHKGRACVLEVDLSGTIIPGQVGYRAEHIEVLKVTVPSRCITCDRHATVFAAKKGLLFPTCGRHEAHFKKPVVSLGWLRDQLRTEIEWEKQITRQA
jgi:hypothetical protein